ncbi:carbohydrate ABC transporter permease [Athalassotoga saccharophila]|uniref:carbohydrate ABC transporter permease n=1 Tax=Athalassotoga saccharophila TaxID=1441386 RepID=UPI00137B2C73|nr:carbohydrate ABC transporter permease [Athalassotoga saccharophila]BBJ28243.1 L-arabinose transport system permease protein AraQ [Athalassotoga saccharophila]
MKKPRKKLLYFFYYVAAVILAIFAIGPLVWMVDTSFKTNAEVLSYPPKWGTINAMPSRTLSAEIVKTRAGQNANPSSLSLEALLGSLSTNQQTSLSSPDTLAIHVLGASGYRGTGTMPRRGILSIELMGEDGGFASYSTNFSTPDFNSVVAKISSVSTLTDDVRGIMNSLSQYTSDPQEYILNFYDDFLYGNNPVFARINFISNLLNVNGMMKFQDEISPFKKGVGPLSAAELKELAGILQSALSTASPSDKMEIEKYLNDIDVYLEFNEFYQSQKNKKLSGPIKLAFIPNSNQLKIIDGQSIVESAYTSGDQIYINFKNVSFVWFLNSDVSLTAHYNFWEVLANFFDNYVSAWNSAPFGIYYFNSIFVAVATTVLNIIFDVMMAFAFSKLTFPGRDKIFIGVIATMMIPYQVLLVADYLIIHSFGWINTYYALIIPWSATAFVIFLMRQSFNSIPNDLYDAAKIDGASSWRFLWTIAVPLSMPVVITGALLTFLGSWNSFLWVLIMTDTTNMRTLPVGLQNFIIDSGAIFNQLMAAATFTMIPVVVAFLFFQKYFVSGFFRSGIK